MRWKDIKRGYVFNDGSTVTQIHEKHEIFCYRFWLRKHPRKIKDNSLVISEDHYILCDVSKVDKEFLIYLEKVQQTNIPRSYDHHFYLEEGRVREETEIVEQDSWIVSENERWLSGRSIFTLLMNKQKVRPVGNRFAKWEAVGEKECFCISTDIGQYECCGVVSHNSVALRNIIFHGLTHSDDIKLGLVDLKLSEFSGYKGMNNVVGVANSVLEAAELLRLAREVMYKRNAENSERQITSFNDYKPTKPLPIIRIFGREFPEDQEFKIKIGENSEEQTMTAKEILEYMESQ